MTGREWSRLRKAHKLKQRELAALIRATPDRISYVERGLGEYRLAEIEALKAVFGLNDALKAEDDPAWMERYRNLSDDKRQSADSVIEALLAAFERG